jgi:hypothetical protein
MIKLEICCNVLVLCMLDKASLHVYCTLINFGWPQRIYECITSEWFEVMIMVHTVRHKVLCHSTM